MKFKEPRRRRWNCAPDTAIERVLKPYKVSKGDVFVVGCVVLDLAWTMANRIVERRMKEARVVLRTMEAEAKDINSDETIRDFSGMTRPDDQE